MEFILFHLFALLNVAFVASHAVVSSEDYWKSVLPNTPMPKSISELLRSPDGLMDDKSTAINTGKGGITNVQVEKGSGLRVSTGQPDKRTNANVRKGGILVDSGNKGKLVYVGVKPDAVPNIYGYAASKAQLHDNPYAALFFLEKDVLPGRDIYLHFIKSKTPAMFLPRNVADSFPFSSEKLPEILSKFSVKQNTMESETMKNTIDECEAPGIRGGEKYCATSLESMIDFTTSRLGKKVNAVSTEFEKESEMQKYRIVGLKVFGKKVVICHKTNYAYAVFYCHNTNSVKAYAISLVGNDGTKAKAAAVCHTDTSSWNPKHMAFHLLNVKPGSVPVCHFLPEDHVVWVAY